MTVLALENLHLAREPSLPLDVLAGKLEKLALSAADLAQARRRVDTQSSEAQVAAGNYAKGHVTWQGLPIAIENPKGSTRSGTDKQGKAWSVKMRHDYGYFKGIKGRDKDHLGAFLGPDLDSKDVFVVNQNDPDTGRFDEHKVVVGCHTVADARRTYLANYAPGWQGCGSIRRMSLTRFKKWTKRGTVTKRAGERTTDEPVGCAETGRDVGRIAGGRTDRADSVSPLLRPGDLLEKSGDAQAGRHVREGSLGGTWPCDYGGRPHELPWTRAADAAGRREANGGLVKDAAGRGSGGRGGCLEQVPGMDSDGPTTTGLRYSRGPETDPEGHGASRGLASVPAHADSDDGRTKLSSQLEVATDESEKSGWDKYAYSYELTGNVQGVGLRAALHQILEARGLPGLAYNDARTGKVYATVGGKKKDREAAIADLQERLDLGKAGGNYQLLPSPRRERMRPVALTDEQLANAYKRQGFTTLGDRDTEAKRDWAIKRFRLKYENGLLSGRVPPLAYKQLQGMEPVYEGQVTNPEEFGPQFWREPEKFAEELSPPVERIGVMTKIAMEKMGVFYHGSSELYDELAPMNTHGDPGIPPAVFATPSKQMALGYLGRRWGDRDIVQGSTGFGSKRKDPSKANFYMAEMRPGAFKEIFDKAYGHLYTLPEEGFVDRPDNTGSKWEQISLQPVKPLRVRRIADALKALKRSGVRMLPYDPQSREYKGSVKFMANRLKRMTPEEQASYLKWQAEVATPETVAEFKRHGVELPTKQAGEKATARCPGCGRPFPKGEPYPDVEMCEACERYGPPKEAGDLTGMGIPDRLDYGDLSKLKAGELADFIVQLHNAQRAGRHFDYRIGSPELGLYSWASKHELPEPGKRRAFFQQPLHAHAYGNFQGTLKGYGSGTVRTHRRGQVMLTKVSPTKVEFTTADERYPQRYALVKPQTFKDKDWLLVNTTPNQPVPYQKQHMVKIPREQVEETLKQLKQGDSAQAKIDGASSLIRLLKDGVEVMSYRASKVTGRPIVYTERVLRGRPQMQIPPELVGSVLKGELYGSRDDTAGGVAGNRNGSGQAGQSLGQAEPATGGLLPAGDQHVAEAPDDATGQFGTKQVIAPQELGGLLTSSLGESLRQQQERNIRLRVMLHGIQQVGRRQIDPNQVPYGERQDLIRAILSYLPADTFHPAESAQGPEAAGKLWQQVSSGQHPMTREGIVIHPELGNPRKAKLLEEQDVHITGTFPGAGKYQGVGAGGFTYAMQPGGPTVGRVGTGLSDALRQDLHLHGPDYVGRVARVRSQGPFESGALRAPALIALHEDYPLAEDKLAYDLFTLQENGIIKTAEEDEERIPTVAVDLDGTIAEELKEFDPDKIGPPRKGIRKWLHKFRGAGARIIVFTVRGDEDQVADYLEEHGLPYDYINYNPDQPEGTSGKVIADVYWDDRAISAKGPVAASASSVLDRLKAASDEEPLVYHDPYDVLCAIPLLKESMGD